jgi:uncharacterized protein
VLQLLKGFGLVPLLTNVAASRHSDAAASIRLLLEAGAVVDGKPGNNSTLEHTALMVACCLPNNLDAIQALLEGGADPCYRTSSYGATALHLAAMRGLTDICRALHAASSGRVLELTGKGDGQGMTPLLSACAMKQHAVVELLCTLGADVNAIGANGISPLIPVVAEQDRSILQCLLQQDGIMVNQRNKDGYTALMKVAQSGNAAAVNLLLQHGADACLVNKSGVSAVLAAAAGGHLHIMKLLIQHGADVTATATQGLTVLMQTAVSNQLQVAEFLISKSLSVHAVNEVGNTALHYAALFTSTGTETMSVLLAHGADINASTHEQTGTPLQTAARSGQLDKVEFLIAAGADVLYLDAQAALCYI